jgi:hypothetical protein
LVEVKGGWTTFCNEKLHNFNSSPNIIRVIKWKVRPAEHVACMTEIRGMCKIFV